MYVKKAPIFRASVCKPLIAASVPTAFQKLLDNVCFKNKSAKADIVTQSACRKLPRGYLLIKLIFKINKPF